MPRRVLKLVHSKSADGYKFLVVAVSIAEAITTEHTNTQKTTTPPRYSASFVEGESEGITKAPIKATYSHRTKPRFKPQIHAPYAVCTENLFR